MTNDDIEQARSIARRWMAVLTTEIDELRENASLDGLVDKVQSTHRHIVSRCMDEIVRSGVGDHLDPMDATMLINEEMRLAFNYGKRSVPKNRIIESMENTHLHERRQTMDNANAKAIVDEVKKSVPEGTWHRDQAWDFFKEWLIEAKKEMKKKPAKRKRGSPMTRVVRQWLKFYGDDEVADIRRVATRFMERLVDDFIPELKIVL